MRAALDAVSDEQDPILSWTSYPWIYLDLHRTSATRYIWKTFLLGEIYLGRTSDDYVLDGTWDNFADDLDDSDPVAYVVETDNPVDETTPFADAVDRRFTTVWEDEQGTLAFRDDVAEWLEPTTDGTALDLADGDAITTGDETRIDAELDASVPTVEFGIVGTDGVDASITVDRTAADRVDVRSWRSGVAEWVRGVDAPADAGIVIVVADDAVMVAVDGVVAGAVSREPDTPVVLRQGAAGLVNAVRVPADRATPP